MTSTLMGSGSAAFSPADPARALAIGLRQANRRLAQVGWPVIERLTLVELYADRAVDAWYGLNVLTQSAPGDRVTSTRHPPSRPAPARCGGRWPRPTGEPTPTC